MKNSKNKTHILFRYGIISLVLFVLSGAIILQLFNTTVLKAAKWNERAQRELSKTEDIPPLRGEILSDNGSILACNVMVYDVCLDMRHPRLAKITIGQSSIDSLADSLDLYYPRKGYSDAKTEAEKIANSWRTYLTRQNNYSFNDTLRRRCIFLAKGVQEEDVNKIKSMPFLCNFIKYKGTMSPVFTKKRDQRIYPFGKLANLSIGRVNFDTARKAIHGYYGLERDLDSLLFGIPGTARLVTSTSGMTTKVEKPVQNGKTLLTTINIDMQEMLEEELIKICNENNAVWGTAILMEVATGEIKAISSVENNEKGFGESMNRAIEPFEPGSVMKPISMLIALEDGLVKDVNSTVDCSPFQRTTDHGGPKVKTVKQVIETSSNTGMARIIFRGYENHPEKFYDRLQSIGFLEPMHTGIAGEYTPKIRRLSEYDENGKQYNMTQRHLDLARQAFGYVAEISPMSTLSVYNAIANGGRYVRPHLVRGYRNPDGKDSIFPIDYIRDRICTEEHAAMLRECIREVVYGNHGTARMLKDDRVEIAGKTGTAFPVQNGAYDQSKRRFAFCGFFPYDNPKYSCMVLILAPKGGNSAASTSGKVLLNMALKMYAHGMLTTPPTIENNNTETPVAVATMKANVNKVASDYGVKNYRSFAKPAASQSGTMPNVIGLDIASALKILEKAGLKVSVSGLGYVSSQSIATGSKITKGQHVSLKLKS